MKKLIMKVGIHSGKGGVGKTFISVNIAYSLSEFSNVGLIDADIDCPNVSAFLNISKIANDPLIPVIHNKVKIVSTALFNPPGSRNPIIIRGPIKHNMIADFLNSVKWGDIDHQIIDFPPGTADAPLSLMQLTKLDGIILVTTPNKESLLDTARAANMAKKMEVPILGLIENMSGEIFGYSGENLSKELNIPFLASIPLKKEIAIINEASEIAFQKLPELYSAKSNILKVFQ